MSLPRKLKNFNVFNDGNSYLGQAKELALPKLAIATEAYRGAGMLSEVDIDMGLEKMELEATYGGIVPGIMRMFGTTKIAGAMVRFVGAYQSDDNGGVSSAELVVRGRHTEIDPGSAKTADDTEWKVKTSIVYLKWTVAGRVEVEIDVINNVFLVNGVDRMAQIRAALGQ